MMTSKERFLTAITGGIPDRVPVTPDISNYIPCKRTKRPFWDIYFLDKYPLWKAYIEASEYFDIDPWLGSCTAPIILDYENNDTKTTTHSYYSKNDDAYIMENILDTPEGSLSSQDICFRSEPPSPLKKPIKNIKEDYKKYKYLFPIPKSLNIEKMDEMRKECESRNYAFGVCIGYTGFHAWNSIVEDSLMQLSCIEYDNPKILEDWAEYDLKYQIKLAELLIEYGVDYITLGGSGTITLSSPELVKKYAIPALKKITKLTNDAGIPTVLHSCGKSRELVDMLVEGTNVSCINPLEIKPMGDVDLKEVKKARGSQIALMGNLHTTSVMLNGSVEYVKEKAREAIKHAGNNGGFILSTGDQCGPATPEENIFAMVEIAKESKYLI